MARPKPTQEQIVERFWSKVNKDGPIHPHLKSPCWVWQRNFNNNGYGVFSVNCKNSLAHRFSYNLHNTPLTSSKVLVCHKCDNKWCVNPEHLFAGNHTDNQMDAMSKGRWWFPERAKGENNPAAKLCVSQVLEIRELLNRKVPQKHIASKFGISVHLVRKISYRSVWKHI